MFSFLAIIGVIASIILLGGMISSGFEDPSVNISFFSMLFSTILCFKLAKMDQKISDNEDEIYKLKTHLGLKDGDLVKESPLEEETYDDEIEHIDYDGDLSDFEVYDNEEIIQEDEQA